MVSIVGDLPYDEVVIMLESRRESLVLEELLRLSALCGCTAGLQGGVSGEGVKSIEIGILPDSSGCRRSAYAFIADCCCKSVLACMLVPI